MNNKEGRGGAAFASFNFHSLDTNTTSTSTASSSTSTNASATTSTNASSSVSVIASSNNELTTSIVRPVAVGSQHRRSISLPFMRTSTGRSRHAMPLTSKTGDDLNIPARNIISISNSSNCAASTTARNNTAIDDQDHHHQSIHSTNNNFAKPAPAFTNLAFHSGAHSGFSSIHNGINNDHVNGNANATALNIHDHHDGRRSQDDAKDKTSPFKHFSIHSQSDDDELDFLYSNRNRNTQLSQQQHHQHQHHQQQGQHSSKHSSNNPSSRISISPFEPLTKDRKYTYTSSVVNGNGSGNRNVSQSNNNCVAIGGKISPLPRDEYEAWSRRRETQLQIHLNSQSQSFSAFRPVAVSPLDRNGVVMADDALQIKTNAEDNGHPCREGDGVTIAIENDLIQENHLLKVRVTQLEQMLKDKNARDHLHPVTGSSSSFKIVKDLCAVPMSMSMMKNQNGCHSDNLGSKHSINVQLETGIQPAFVSSGTASTSALEESALIPYSFRRFSNDMIDSSEDINNTDSGPRKRSRLEFEL